MRGHTHVVARLAASARVLTLLPLQASAGTTSAGVAPSDGPAPAARQDDLPHPLGDAQRKLRRQRTDTVTLHSYGLAEKVRSRRGIPVFDDSDPDRYWSAQNPWASTKVAGSGTRIKVLRQPRNRGEMLVRVDSGRKR